MKLRCWLLLGALLWLVPFAQAAHAASAGQDVTAFLDRDHVHLGDTVTLNIQGAAALSANPDLSPLQQDFDVLGTSRSSSVRIVNGQTTSSSDFGIALRPRRAGTLTIPPLDVGGARTPALTVQVLAAPSGARGQVGDPAFLESNVLSSSPYVGQETLYTVRLFYLPGVTDGTLDDPQADGARLIQLDRDRRYVTQRDGYTYQVIERSYALIPQRNGPITVHGPAFHARRLDPNDPNSLFNNLIGAIGTPVQARAADLQIVARAPPAGAGQPWLPAHSVKLQLSGLPANGEVAAGVPLTVTLAIDASGLPAEALPEPQLPPIAGAHVYPDQTQDSTDDSGEWLEGSRTRSFAIVPDRNGSLTIPAITLDWWDVVHDHAERAVLPARTLQVTGAAANASSAPPVPAGSTANTAAAAAGTTTPPVSSAAGAPEAVAPAPWRTIALASFALWVLAVTAAVVWWQLFRRRGGKAAAAVQPSALRVPRDDARVLQQHALDAARAGDAAACERTLLAWAREVRPGITHAGALREALADPAQREALDALERARWQGGDAAPACADVARAFARGFAWRAAEDHPRASTRQDLPPLYPS